MASKRKIDEIQSSEDFRRLFATAIVTYEKAELAVLWLMREYRFDLSILQQALIGSVLLSSFGSIWLLTNIFYQKKA